MLDYMLHIVLRVTTGVKVFTCGKFLISYQPHFSHSTTLTEVERWSQQMAEESFWTFAGYFQRT